MNCITQRVLRDSHLSNQVNLSICASELSGVSLINMSVSTGILECHFENETLSHAPFESTAHLHMDTQIKQDTLYCDFWSVVCSVVSGGKPHEGITDYMKLADTKMTKKPW